jgi:hypothetical protein
MATPNKGNTIAGPLKRKFREDTYNLLDGNLIQGGEHLYTSVVDACEKLTYECMRYWMPVIIMEDSANGIPAQIYRMRRLPYFMDADPSKPVLRIPLDVNGEPIETGYTRVQLTQENFFSYFVVENNDTIKPSGDPVTRYTPDYEGSYYDDKPEWMDRTKPPYPDSADQAWFDANVSTEFDPSIHKWQSDGFVDGPFSRWYSIYGDYKPQDFIDVRQLFILKTEGAIEAPPYTREDGRLNNSPVYIDGRPWQDVAILPEGANIEDYNLWEIEAPKNVYDQLKAPWTIKLIRIVPNLVRYSMNAVPDPNDIVSTTQSAAAGTAGDIALNEAGIVAVPNGNVHRFRWSRSDNGNGTYTNWRLQQFANESGEYQDFMYREFPISLIDYILNNPDALYTTEMGGDNKPFRPTSKVPAAWKERPFNPQSGFFLAKIETRKFFNGELKRPWSDPVPDGSVDTPIDYISSDSGNDFKYNSDGQVLNPIIKLKANLFLGAENLNDLGVVTYQWTRIYNGGGDVVIGPEDNFGTAQEASITNEDVDGKAIFQVKQTWTKLDGSTEDFIEEYELLDVKDGMNARILTLSAPDKVFFANGDVVTPSQIKIRAFTQNIFDNDQSFTWKRAPLADTEDPAFSWANVAALAATGDHIFVYPTDFDGTNNDYSYYCEAVDALGRVFYDSVNLHKIALESGSSAFTVVLSNPVDTVPTEPDGTLVDPNLTNRYTTYQIFEGAVDKTSEFTVSASVENIVKADLNDTTNNTVTVDDTVAGKVKLTAWGTNVKEATVTITFNRSVDGVVLTRDYKLRREKGFTDFYVLDLDCGPNGLAFSPGDTTAKIVTANIIKNGVPLSVAEYDLVTIKYFDEFSGYDIYTADLWDKIPLDPIENTQGRKVSIGPERVDFKNTVICMVELPNGQKISRQIVITEVKDAKGLMILYHSSDPKIKPALPTLTNDEYNALGLDEETANGYYKSTDYREPNWRAEKSEDAATWRLYLIGGEAGAAGQNGGYPIYYFFAANEDVTVVKPHNDRTPLTAEGEEKDSFTDQNGRIWQRKASSLSWDKTTQNIWRVAGNISFDSDNKRQFFEWDSVTIFAHVEPKDGVGKDGEDGSFIHSFTGDTPPQDLGKSGDWAYNGEDWYLKNADGLWEFKYNTKAIDGTDGITTGIQWYKFAPGGSLGTAVNMGNFSQGQVIDTGDSTSKKLRIRGWVSVSVTQGRNQLKLVRDTSSSGYGGTTISQRTYHSNSGGYVEQYQIEAYVTTTNRYIKFTFSDLNGDNKYWDYGLEVYKID